MKKLLAVLAIQLACIMSLYSQDLYEEPEIISFTVASPSDLVGDDYDLDGDIDLIAAGIGQSQLYYFENLGEGEFADEQILNTELDGPRHLASSDMDGDGDADLLCCSYTDDKIFFL